MPIDNLESVDTKMNKNLSNEVYSFTLSGKQILLYDSEIHQSIRTDLIHSLKADKIMRSNCNNFGCSFQTTKLVHIFSRMCACNVLTSIRNINNKSRLLEGASSEAEIQFGTIHHIIEFVLLINELYLFIRSIISYLVDQKDYFPDPIPCKYCNKENADPCNGITYCQRYINSHFRRREPEMDMSNYIEHNLPFPYNKKSIDNFIVLSYKFYSALRAVDVHWEAIRLEKTDLIEIVAEMIGDHIYQIIDIKYLLFNEFLPTFTNLNKYRKKKDNTD